MFLAVIHDNARDMNSSCATELTSLKTVARFVFVADSGATMKQQLDSTNAMIAPDAEVLVGSAISQPVTSPVRA